MEGAMGIELNENLYLSLFSCLIIALIAFKLTRRKRSKFNLPPSPPKLPTIGNLHQLGTLPHLSFRVLSKKHGPLMFLRLGQIPILVVSSVDLAREMAKTNDIVFSDRPSKTAAKILFYGCKDMGFEQYGEDWRQKRKISVVELLSTKQVRSYHSIREEEVSELVNEIREACKKSDGSSVSVNLSKLLVSSSNNIASRCIFGHKYKTLDGNSSSKSFGEIERKVMYHFREFSFEDFFPSLWWTHMDVVTGLVPRMKATFKELDAFMDQVIAEHENEKSNNVNKDFVDILLQLQHDKHDDFELSLDSIKATIMGLFAGASDTTSTTMEWAMAELVRHPGKMEKAQKEVRSVVGYKSKIEGNDVNQMSYLKCVVKETLRLHPPAPLIARETNRSVKLGGYDIPAKTSVLVNAWAIQRDADQWERPEEFVPERFENSEVDFKGQDNFQFIPFGFGRRACPGLTFGVASIEYTLCNLLYWFDWKLPAGTITSLEDIDMSDHTNGLTVNKKLPLHLQPVPYIPFAS